jgi:hypothetical protein
MLRSAVRIEIHIMRAIVSSTRTFGSFSVVKCRSHLLEYTNLD